MQEISTLLRQDPAHPDLPYLLNDLFFEEVRRHVQNSIAVHFQRRISGQDVANDAFRSLMSEIEKKRLQPESRKEFLKLWKVLAERKLTDAFRRHGNQKRSVGQGSSADVEQMSTASIDKLVKNLVSETAAVSAAKLIKECEEDAKHEFRLLISVLGVLCEHSPGNVLTALEVAFPGRKLPSLRFVQARIRSDRERLLQLLQEMGDRDDREP